MLKSRTNTIVACCLLVFSVFGIIKLQLPLTEEKNSSQVDRADLLRQEEREAIRVNFLRKLPNFGFNNLVADWTYLQFVQYFGDRARDETGYRLNPEYFETFVQKDPRFVAPYFIFAPATTIFSGRPDISVKVMEDGLKYIQPEQELAYQLWLYKGVDELLFVGKPQEAKLSYQMASQWAKYHDDEASQRAGIQAQQTADFLATNPNSRKAQAAAWMNIYTNAREDVVKKLAWQNIKRLGGKLTVTSSAVSLTFPEQD